MSLAMTSSQSIAVSVAFGLGLGFVSVAWAAGDGTHDVLALTFESADHALEP
jgi:hypothetical protein